ncbi:hypothetical protein DFH06DRAFT_987244 [Mycena polygramma]|nr:hypothetical protein DFH06DRAFT_987244 [Mycena polygramma]
MGPRVPEPVDYGEWRPTSDKSNKRKKEVADQNVETETPEVVHKKRKTAVSLDVSAGANDLLAGVVPAGMIWDSVDHSCGYDAMFGILANLWAESPELWSANFATVSALMKLLTDQLWLVVNGRITLEEGRNVVRRRMHAERPEFFPYGPNTTSIDRIARALLPEKDHAKGTQTCSHCGYIDPTQYGLLDAFACASLNSNEDNSGGVRLSEWLKKDLTRGLTNCPSCRRTGRRQRMTMNVTINEVPPVMIISMDHPRLVIDPMIHFDCRGELTCMKLRGIIYLGHAHFTCRMITKTGAIWFHDGIATGRRCRLEGNLTHVVDFTDLSESMGNRVVAVIYARAD